MASTSRAQPSASVAASGPGSASGALAAAGGNPGLQEILTRPLLSAEAEAAEAAIAADGRAREADTGAKVAKQWLGRRGAMIGAPVRLAPPSDHVIAGEGIETTLAALATVRAAGDERWTAEACLSRDAVALHWGPPEGARLVLILGEGSSRDPATAEAKAEQAAVRLRALGCEVRIWAPPEGWGADVDFADAAAAARARP